MAPDASVYDAESYVVAAKMIDMIENAVMTSAGIGNVSRRALGSD